MEAPDPVFDEMERELRQRIETEERALLFAKAEHKPLAAERLASLLEQLEEIVVIRRLEEPDVDKNA